MSEEEKEVYAPFSQDQTDLLVSLGRTEDSEREALAKDLANILSKMPVLLKNLTEVVRPPQPVRQHGKAARTRQPERPSEHAAISILDSADLDSEGHKLAQLRVAFMTTEDFRWTDYVTKICESVDKIRKAVEAVSQLHPTHIVRKPDSTFCYVSASHSDCLTKW